MCVPDEGGSIKVYNSTQFADAAQEAVAHALGLRLHEVDVICRRVGGGFGGKLNRWVLLWCLASSARWWWVVGGVEESQGNELGCVPGRP